MISATYKEVKTWPNVSLIRGIKMSYKGRDMYFPKVYFGESEMGDFDTARGSIDYKEAPEEQKEQIALRKAMTLCARILLRDGYAAEDVDKQEKYALRERDRIKIQHKIEKAEDDKVIETLTKELDKIPSLVAPSPIFPAEEEVLNFAVKHMSGQGVRPVDNIRMVQAYSKLNLFEQEEIEDFLSFPGV